jgi:multiple sugar transport system permease protein
MAASRARLAYGRWTPFWFLAPSVAALFVIGIYPTLFALVTSLRQYNLARAREGFPFVWLANYVNVLTDGSFWQTLGRTLFFFVCVMPAEVGLGLVIALLLHQQRNPVLRAVTRVSLVVPLATTYAVVGLLGRLLFNRDFGIVDAALGAVGIAPVDWLGSPAGSFVAICTMDVWQWTPFCALIFLSGLSMVPVDIEEAARLETTSRWALLREVQLPYLRPGLTAMLILRSADVLKLFDTVYTMTRGGPGDSTELISIYIQRIGFRVFDIGTASAQALLLLVLTIVLSRVYIRLVYREVA